MTACDPYPLERMVETMLHEMCHVYETVRYHDQACTGGHDEHFGTKISVVHRRAKRPLDIGAYHASEPFVQHRFLPGDHPQSHGHGRTHGNGDEHVAKRRLSGRDVVLSKAALGDVYIVGRGRSYENCFQFCAVLFKKKILSEDVNCHCPPWQDRLFVYVVASGNFDFMFTFFNLLTPSCIHSDCNPTAHFLAISN